MSGLGGLEALLIAAETESRPFDRLLVTDCSRLSRNNDVDRRIIKAFAFYGVPIFSVQDSEIIDESLRHLPDFHSAVYGSLNGPFAYVGGSCTLNESQICALLKDLE
jgi:DNA invertase Pin-like site-specific DNA recombinase